LISLVFIIGGLGRKSRDFTDTRVQARRRGENSLLPVSYSVKQILTIPTSIRWSRPRSQGRNPWSWRGIVGDFPRTLVGHRFSGTEIRCTHRIRACSDHCDARFNGGISDRLGRGKGQATSSCLCAVREQQEEPGKGADHLTGSRCRVQVGQFNTPISINIFLTATYAGASDGIFTSGSPERSSSTSESSYGITASGA
jgi:hypothetical protein